MGWKVGEIQERITPIVAEKDVESEFLKIQAGSVAGVRQVAKGILAGQELVVLDLRIYIGAQNPHDSILIEGVPPIDMTIKGGVHGDRATPAIVVNTIPRLEFLQAGLRTMIDVPPPSARLDSVGEDSRSCSRHSKSSLPHTSTVEIKNPISSSVCARLTEPCNMSGPNIRIPCSSNHRKSPLDRSASDVRLATCRGTVNVSAFHHSDTGRTKEPHSKSSSVTLMRVCIIVTSRH